MVRRAGPHPSEHEKVTRGPTHRPVRVAVLDHTAQLGGAELALLRLLDALAERAPGRFAVHVILLGDGPLVGRLEEAGHSVEVIRLADDLATRDRYAAGSTPLTDIRDAVRTLPLAWRVARRLRQLEVDVVHTTSLKADLIGVPVARLARRPLVWHVHDRIATDYLPPAMVRLVRGLARRAPHHVVANSHATAATLPGVRRLTVVHPGLAADQYAPAPRLRQPAGAPLVGMVGRISPTKGQLVLVRAAALVLVNHPEARFVIVGEASFGAEDYAKEVRSEIARLGLTDRFVLTGFVRDPVVEIDRLTVCVHGATVPEPFGQVVVEAMARGVPVIASRGGGVDEILAAPAPALTVPPGDPDALAAAIVRTVADPEAALARASQAWTTVRDSYGIGSTADGVAAVWSGVAGLARGGPRHPGPGGPTR